MGAVFTVFVGPDDPNRRCFNKCVTECRRTGVLNSQNSKSISTWRGYKRLMHALENSAVGTRRKSSGGYDSVYGCPKAVLLMSGLARLCLQDVLRKNSAILKKLHQVRAIEHARTVVTHDNSLVFRQTYLWVNRGSGSAPEEVPEEKDGDEKKDGDKIESSADAYSNMAGDDSNMADNEDSGAGNGSDTTYSGSRRANDASSSEENESSS
ncbi:hypothetical protein H0G86_010994 [Trichoderma simmonsii]|uniref:Uncharacterized protein n=1 Tax=Trichoderma simmonsii TaxID=1491479 RepID=A0A8G0LQM1_9HYPO|nr:hypothetical protein H0G86_010994 [Trichoderma simmonsii]